METFSVVLIAKNEEKSLPNLLKSLEAFKAYEGSEVILCDTGSTDNTVQIAKDWGCKVYEEGSRFCKVFTKEEVRELQSKYTELLTFYDKKDVDFASMDSIRLSIEPNKPYFQYDIARNYANSLATNDWIFSPDCDEVVEWDLEAVHNLLRSNDHIRYNFVFAFDEWGDPAIQFQHSKFFRRSKLTWKNHIHEILQPIEGQTPKEPVFTEHIYLKHHQNASQSRGHYLPMLEYDVITNPTNDRNCYYLSREYMYMGRWEDAIKMFTYYLSLPTGWWPEQGQAKIHIGDCYKGLGKLSEAEEWYHRAMQHDPTRREAFFQAGQLCQERKDWQQSSIYFSGAQEIPYHGGFYGTDVSLYKDRIHLLQSVNYYYLGKKEEAFEELYKALQEKPKDELILSNFKYLMDFPKVTIVIPTIDRNTTALMESLKNDNYFGEEEVTIAYDFRGDGCPKTVNIAIVFDTKTDFVVFLGDDCIVEKNWLNHAMIEYYKSFKDGIGLVALNDGMHFDDWKPKLASHWLSNKKLLPYLEDKQFFWEGVSHYGCDDILTWQCQIMNRLAYTPHAIVRHNRVEDATSIKAKETYEKDREITSNKLKELREKYGISNIKT